MKKFYLAVTYEICEHNNLYLDMNEYNLDSSKDLTEQVREFAKMDVAPLVKVYESNSRDFIDMALYKEFTFKEFECGCSSSEF
jgi:hypothetical protein